jgi:hypothetical protein
VRIRDSIESAGHAMQPGRQDPVAPGWRPAEDVVRRRRYAASLLETQCPEFAIQTGYRRLFTFDFIYFAMPARCVMN